jgi:hypothetical protein
MHAAYGLSLEDLLESFAADTAYMPAGASPVRAARDLPRALLRFVRPGARNEAWRAWTHEHRIWFVTGRLSAADAAAADGAAVHVFFYSQTGNLLCSGVWELKSSGRWKLRAVAGTPPRALAPSS